jgi:hypothetical protein
MKLTTHLQLPPRSKKCSIYHSSIRLGILLNELSTAITFMRYKYSVKPNHVSNHEHMPTGVRSGIGLDWIDHIGSNEIAHKSGQG